MELYGSLVANEGSGGGGGGTADVPIKSISVNGSGVAPVNKNVNIDVPTKTSELQNDSNFASTNDIPTKTSELQNDSNFASTADIPTKVSELENDSKFVTEDELTAKGYASTSDIPTKTSQLTNDSSFVTESDLTAKDYADKTYVGEQIAQSEHLKREIVTVLPEPTVADEHTIYMLKDDSVKGSDKYKEYMLIEGVVQCVGDTSVDLTDYAKTADIPTELPANGGNADTVNNHTVKSDVPENAVFTDTIYDDTEVKGSIEKVNSNLTKLKYSEVAGGKNLLDFNSRIVDSLLNNTTGEVVKNSSSVGYWISQFIPVKAGEKYAVDNTSNSDIYWYDDNYSFINKSQGVGFNKLTTAPSNAKFLRIDCSDKGTIHSNAIIVENDSTIPYEPYIPSVKMLSGVVNQQNESLSVIGKCKNLLNPTLQTTTQNGVTCTNNGDGTYTLNGTATHYTNFVLINEGTAVISQMIAGKTFKVTGFKETGNYRLECTAWLTTGGTYVFDSRIWNVPNGAKGLRIDIVVLSGATLNDVVVKPMLTTDLSATYEDFVPYTGDGKPLTHDVAEIKKDLGDLTFSANGTTLSITDGTHTWTLNANN